MAVVTTCVFECEGLLLSTMTAFLMFLVAEVLSGLEVRIAAELLSVSAEILALLSAKIVSLLSAKIVALLAAEIMALLPAKIVALCQGYGVTLVSGVMTLTFAGKFVGVSSYETGSAAGCCQ